MVREDTWVPSEGATCAWMTAEEAVGCTRAFLTMWWTSRRLVCRGHPETGLRVNDIARINWFQNLFKTQSEQPKVRGTRLDDHPASLMPMILPSEIATAARIIFENGVMTRLPQLLLFKDSAHSNKL
ncbi:uncharacterized protein TNCV_3591301 [Trichonephila clavipes]|nr:uncharacterized protein TNCV_3591301 [Trichonephila clavipes]